MKKLILYTLCTILIACSVENNTASNNNVKDEKSNIDIPDNKKDSIVDDLNQDALLVDKEVDSICNWLFSDFLGAYEEAPTYYLNDDGYYLLDVDGHIDTLKSMNVFTDNFLRNEYVKFSACSDTLIKGKLRPEDFETDIEMEGPDQCAFFNYMYYFQSQESPHKFELKKTNIESNKIYTEMHFYEIHNGKKFSWDYRLYLKLEMIKDSNGYWKFNNVEKINVK